MFVNHLYFPPINWLFISCISIHCCITNYPKFNGLPHTLIISLFLWSESVHGFAESSPSMSLEGLHFHPKVYVKKDPLLSSNSCWWNSLPWGLLDWGSSIPYWIGIGQKPLSILCHVGLSSVAVPLAKVCNLRGNQESASKTVLCNLITKVTSHQHCCILFVISKS